MKLKFYHCPVCGNVIVKLVDSTMVPVCCHQTMKSLHHNTAIAQGDCHIPVWERTSKETILVSVGEKAHPMTMDHHIRFVCLQTAKGFQVHYLRPDMAPEVVFHTECDPIAVYAYCNRHGMWCSDGDKCEKDT